MMPARRSAGRRRRSGHPGVTTDHVVRGLLISLMIIFGVQSAAKDTTTAPLPDCADTSVAIKGVGQDDFVVTVDRNCPTEEHLSTVIEGSADLD
jgi:hypothetical protein